MLVFVCKTMYVLFQNRYATNALAFCHCFASSAHAEKMQALFRLCLLSFRTYVRNPLERHKPKPAERRSKASPFLTEFPPFPFPLLLCNKESTESPTALGTTGFRKSLFRATPLYGRGHSRSRSARTFPNCVTRFRGGALRHAKFPKTSYCLQLLDTLKHAACVNLNRGRRRSLIFLSSKVLAPFKQNASVLSGEGYPRTPTRHLRQSRLSAIASQFLP